MQFLSRIFDDDLRKSFFDKLTSVRNRVHVGAGQQSYLITSHDVDDIDDVGFLIHLAVHTSRLIESNPASSTI